MNTRLLKDALLWGFLLWLIGYALGVALYFVVPAPLLGWVITPIGIFITLWILYKKVKQATMRGYLAVAVAWTIIAIVGDYLFVVKALHPADGYYKPDVYLYYTLTSLLPLLVGSRKTSAKPKP